MKTGALNIKNSLKFADCFYLMHFCYIINMRCDVKHETAKREYPDIDVYGTAQQRFRFQFREFERNQDD